MGNQAAGPLPPGSATGKDQEDTDMDFDEIVDDILHRVKPLVSDVFCCRGDQRDGRTNANEACGICDAFEESHEDGVRVVPFAATYKGSPEFDEYAIDTLPGPGARMGRIGRMDSMSPPKRSAPAAPKGVDHDAVDASMDACRKLQDMEPPPRGAPGFSSKQDMAPPPRGAPGFSSKQKPRQQQGASKENFRPAPNQSGLPGVSKENFRPAPNQSGLPGVSGGTAWPQKAPGASIPARDKQGVCNPSSFRTIAPKDNRDDASIIDGWHLIHINIGSTRRLQMPFLDSDDLEDIISKFLKQNGLPASLKAGLLKRAEGLVALGLSEGSVDIGSNHAWPEAKPDRPTAPIRENTAARRAVRV